MDINLNSWHGRIAQRWAAYPRGLCWYFWKIVITLAFVVATGVCAVVGGAIALVFMSYPIARFFFDMPPAFALFSFILWLIASAALIAFLRAEGLAFTWRCPPPEDDGLVRSYLRAKHHKVCPRLNYRF